MALYVGIDLHSSNAYVGILDGGNRRIGQARVRNDILQVLQVLSPYGQEVQGVVVESTYNWYWLVDGLMEAGYRVHLANPAAIQQYTGLKHCDDRHDAFWLATMLKLGILPQGYIYPKEERPVRDLLRKRGHLVRLRTSLMISLQGVITRNSGCRVAGHKVKALRTNHVQPHLCGNEDLELVGSVSKECIDDLTRHIQRIERRVEERAKSKSGYEKLLTIPGVGKILALTILLESGPMERFKKVGNYASYCRKVRSRWESNGKWKGHGNIKNGNRYLAWAFSEVAEIARRYDPACQAYYERKQAKGHRMVAHAALAHKLTRAAYYVLRDHVDFCPEKLFR
jgi:transposase